MTHARCTRGLAALALLGLLATAAAYDVKPSPDPADPKTFDKLVVDTLRDVHNKGADLYNTAKDFAGAYRMYEGSLRTVRPLLAYRPAAQKLIDDGLAAADKEADAARRAFLLHETIEKVRGYLKTAAAIEPGVVVPKKEPVETAPKPEPKKEPSPSPKPKVDTTKPKDPMSVPTPKPKTKTDGTQTTKPPGAGGVSGKVTLAGKPVAKADVLLVSLTLPKPRVFNATTKDDGSFAVTEAVPPGKYVVVVTGKDVPAKYGTPTTSGVTVEVRPGATADIALK